jgi:hypothetical protein
MFGKLNEGLEYGDLKRLVHPELHIDEFRSKLGEDKDVIVVSFKVKSKEPAEDLAGFLERGYESVIDADVSAGEMSDGSYLVFVELDRSPDAAKDIMEFMEDIMNLTEQEVSSWRVRYYKTKQELPLSIEALEKIVPLTPESYVKILDTDQQLDEMRSAAGLPIVKKAPKNDFTEKLRDLAGIAR